QEAWRSIPIVVITAKDLTPDDHRRLNGYVERILQKGAYSPEELLREVRDLVTARVRSGRMGTEEAPTGDGRTRQRQSAETWVRRKLMRRRVMGASCVQRRVGGILRATCQGRKSTFAGELVQIRGGDLPTHYGSGSTTVMIGRPRCHDEAERVAGIVSITSCS